MIDKHSDNWKRLPLWLKCCFSLNFLVAQPVRNTARRIVIASHVSGFLFCLLGLMSEPALVGGLIMLLNAYLFHLLTCQATNLASGITRPMPPSPD